MSGLLQPEASTAHTPLTPTGTVRVRARSVTRSCPSLCNPMDCSPPGSSVHGDSPGKNTGVGCYALLQGIFLTQGLNLHLLHWWVHSLPLEPTLGSCHTNVWNTIYICFCISAGKSFHRMDYRHQDCRFKENAGTLKM